MIHCSHGQHSASGCAAIRREGQAIDRAADAASPTVEHMRVDHSGAHIRVPQELLNCPNVVAVFQDLSGKRVAKGIERKGSLRPIIQASEVVKHFLVVNTKTDDGSNGKTRMRPLLGMGQ